MTKRVPVGYLNGFYAGEKHHPAQVQLLKHCQAVHKTQAPVRGCPACQDILKKIK